MKGGRRPGSIGHVWCVAVVLSCGLVLTIAPGSADAVTGMGIVQLSVQYGPTCVPDKYGGTNCAEVSAGRGIRVWITAYPGAHLFASETTPADGDLTFNQSMPFDVAMFFKGRSHGRSFSGGWRMAPLRSLGGQMIPLALLLCPSGAWVATISTVTDSCASRGPATYASGAPRSSA